MIEAIPVADPLRAFLSGKRNAPRLAVDWPAQVVAPGLELVGRAVDASEGGLLVALADADLARSGPSGGPPTLLGLHERLAGGFEVRLPDRGFARQAAPVRVGRRMGDPDHIYLGCSFLKPLTIGEQRKLGMLGHEKVVVTEAWREPVYLGALPYVAVGAKPAWVVAFEEGDRVMGPLFVGSLAGASGSALAVDVVVPPDRGVFELLGRTAAQLDVLRAGTCVWRGEAVPAAVLLGDRDDRVRIGLQMDRTPPRAVRELLQARG